MMKKLFILTAFVSVALFANAQVWTQQNTNFPGTSTGVDEISIVDANIVWVKGFNGSGTGPAIREFSKTIDGGANWTPGTFGFTANVMPYNFAASSVNNAFAAALDSVTSVASFWGTTDGGTTWAKVSGVLNGASSFADGVEFWDGSKGFCYGDPVGGFFEIFTTVDGGATWTPAVTSVAPSPAAEYGYNGADCSSIVAGSTGVGFIMTDHGRVLKTTDYGVNWAATPTAPFVGTAQWGSIKIFASSANDILCATYTTATTTWTWRVTTDGGTTWADYIPTSGPWYTFATSYVPGTANTFVATSPSGGSGGNGAAISTDGGVNWLDIVDPLFQPAGANIQCLAVGYFDINTGWIGNYDAGQTINSILKYGFPVGVIQQNVNGNDVNIYPNPSNGLVNFTIKGDNTENMNITVYDVMGKMIINQNLNVNGVANTSFDFSSYAKGVYAVQITSGSEITTKKLMIQ